MNKNRNKTIKIALLILTIIGLLTVVLVIYLNTRKPITIDRELIVSKLWQDYNVGTINTDEYVKNILYSQYNRDLLDEKYKSDTNLYLVNVDDFINKHYEELSSDTIKYYLEVLNLKNITFKKDVVNKNTGKSKSLLSNIVDDVYASDEDTTNLNKVVLSSKGNFIVWYTTTGDSATNYDVAKKVAEGLENTVSKYSGLFNHDYTYKATILSKGSRYDDQVEILKDAGINANYLESTMQVYLVNYNNDALAKYINGYGVLSEAYYSLFGGDEYGSIAYPYILIKPSAFSDFERLEQLYNHELFHHYQSHILCGLDTCETGDDEIIIEATANWASALVTDKTTNQGFLNEWAWTERYFSNELLTEDWIDSYGKSNVGYALFGYLYNYGEIVQDGTTKIINSIYEDDALSYLQSNSQSSEREQVQKEIVLKNFSQDYFNANLNVNNDDRRFIKGTLSVDSENNKLIAKNGIEYYKIDTNKEKSIEISVNGKLTSNGNTYCYIIAKKNGEYKIIKRKQFYLDLETFDRFNVNDYEELYIAIANTSLTNDTSYSINVSYYDELPVEQGNNESDQSIEGKEFTKVMGGNEQVTIYFDMPTGFYCPSPVNEGDFYEGAFSCEYYEKVLQTEDETKMFIQINYKAASIKTFDNYFFNYVADDEFYNKNIRTHKIGNKKVYYITINYPEYKCKTPCYLVGVIGYFDLGYWRIVSSVDALWPTKISAEELLEYAYSSSFSTDDGFYVK